MRSLWRQPGSGSGRGVGREGGVARDRPRARAADPGADVSAGIDAGGRLERRTAGDRAACSRRSKELGPRRAQCRQLRRPAAPVLTPVVFEAVGEERAEEHDLQPQVRPDAGEVVVGRADDEVGVRVAVEVADGEGVAEVLVGLAFARDALVAGEEGALAKAHARTVFAHQDRHRALVRAARVLDRRPHGDVVAAVAVEVADG